MFGILALVASMLGWNTYTNVRYGYTTCYPKMMGVGREADNGDGRVFKSNNAIITVWGENNVMDDTPVSRMNMLVRSGDRVTYQVTRPTWTVQSGTYRNTIFWRKIFMRGDQFVVLEIQYLASEKEAGGAVVKNISSCTKLGSPAY